MTSTKLLHALRDPLRTRQRLLDGVHPQGEPAAQSWLKLLRPPQRVVSRRLPALHVRIDNGPQVGPDIAVGPGRRTSRRVHQRLTIPEAEHLRWRRTIPSLQRDRGPRRFGQRSTHRDRYGRLLGDEPEARGPTCDHPGRSARPASRSRRPRDEATRLACRACIPDAAV